MCPIDQLYIELGPKASVNWDISRAARRYVSLHITFVLHRKIVHKDQKEHAKKSEEFAHFCRNFAMGQLHTWSRIII